MNHAIAKILVSELPLAGSGSLQYSSLLMETAPPPPQQQEEQQEKGEERDVAGEWEKVTEEDVLSSETAAVVPIAPITEAPPAAAAPAVEAAAPVVEDKQPTQDSMTPVEVVATTTVPSLETKEETTTTTTQQQQQQSNTVTEVGGEEVGILPIVKVESVVEDVVSAAVVVEEEKGGKKDDGKVKEKDDVAVVQSVQSVPDVQVAVVKQTDGFLKDLAEMAARAKQSSRLRFSDKIELAGLYFQATRGDCKEDAPSRLQMTEYLEWSAWNELRGMSQKEAGERYVSAFTELIGSGKSFSETEDQGKGAMIPGVRTITLERPNRSVPSQPSQPRGRATSVDNSMVFITMGSCVAIFGCGIAGFLFSILSYAALFWLIVAAGGFLGIVGAIMFYFDENGLLPFISKNTQNILFNMTFVDLLLQGTIPRAIKEFITDLAPIILARTEKDKLEALANMSLEKRRKYTTVGVINIMPRFLQKAILPSRMFKSLSQAPPVYRLSPASGRVEELDRVVSGNTTEVPAEPRHDLQRELVLRLFSQGLTLKNSELVVQLVNPSVIKLLGMGTSTFLVAQLAVSQSARDYLRALIKVSLFFGSLLGTGACVALILLRGYAKATLHNLEQKRKEETQQQ